MKAREETLTNRQILEKALDLLIKRNKIIDQALSDASLLSARTIKALKEIDDEVADLRAIQIESRELNENHLSWEELRIREHEFRNRFEKPRCKKCSTKINY